MKQDKIYLEHILDSIDNIEKISARDREDIAVLFSVIKFVEIIGEASNKLSKEFKNTNLQIPWADIIGMRNKLVHDYFGINPSELWNTVDMDIPVLKIEILKLFK